MSRWQPAWDLAGMAIDESVREWLDRVHPLRYALVDGPLVESFRRCPTCEEWSPCTVRERVSELLP